MSDETFPPPPADEPPINESTHEGPLDIEGFEFVRALGKFSIGDSYLYLQRDENRRVHVLLAHHNVDSEEFVRLFLEAIGDESDDLLLYAGLTDRGRPYLVTDFIDDSPDPNSAGSNGIGSNNIDDTILVDRSEEFDETLLSSAQNPSDQTVLSAKSAQTSQALPAPASPSRSTRRELPSLVVSERQAVVPDPAAPASDAVYLPRMLPEQAKGSGLSFPAPKLVTSAPPVSRHTAEQRSARTALIAVAASVLFSVLGATALIWWMLGR